MDEATLRGEEARIPELAARAGRAAHQRALARNGRVVTTRERNVVELRSDGSITVLQALPPGVRVEPGLVLTRGSRRRA